MRLKKQYFSIENITKVNKWVIKLVRVAVIYRSRVNKNIN